MCVYVCVHLECCTEWIEDAATYTYILPGCVFLKIMTVVTMLICALLVRRLKSCCQYACGLKVLSLKVSSLKI